MAMSSGKSGDLNSDINVTPLVDVMLVLLIIFMVTAPMMHTGVDLDLPQGDVTGLPDKDAPLILSIDKKGAVFLGDTPVTWEELPVKLETSAKIKAEHELYVEADENLPYGTVIRAMAIARKAGVAKLQMVTNPLEEEKPGAPATAPATTP